MVRSTRLLILIKNIYTLWGRKRFLLPVTYFPTNLEYPFTFRVTGIKTQIKDSLILNMSQNDNRAQCQRVQDERRLSIQRSCTPGGSGVPSALVEWRRRRELLRWDSAACC